jgi:ribosome-interacting GTPase 1
MPTNLPPEYKEAEQRYRAAGSVADKIARLEELISTVPKHKGTDKLRADLRRKLSKLRSSAQTPKSVSRHESAFHIDREGAGQVVLIGMPNVGKSALVNALTNATPEVAAYPFTTWEPTPGMMLMENVQIQLIDTPPLNPDHVEPELLNLIRRADLLLLVVDLQTDPLQHLEDTLAILEEHRIIPLRWKERYPHAVRLAFKPVIVLANGCDDESWDEDCAIACELIGEDWSPLAVSAVTGRNLEQLKRAVYDRLGIIRIYSRAPGQEPDLSSPFVMERGGTVEEFARKIHQDFYHQLSSARVWGHGVFDGQMVGRDHVLHDGDIVELRI